MKMKKMLCTLLAAAIIFSIPLTSFAEVMNIKKFYDKDENILYYFGNFNPKSDTDAGLEIGGKDYRIDDVSGSYGKFNISKLMDGNFGIGFKNPENLGKVEIKPYAKNAEGEKVYYGKTLSYDPDAVSEETVLTSVETEFGVMAPSFTPDVTKYYIGLANADAIPALEYTAADDCTAAVVGAKASAIGETTTIRVTDADNKYRDYTFTYNLINPIENTVTVNASDSYLITYDKATEKYSYTSSIFNPNVQSDRIGCWKDVKETNEIYPKYDVAVYTYDLTGKTVDNFGKFEVDFTVYNLQNVGQTKFKISALEVENNDLTRSTVTEDTIKKSTISVGKEISSIEIPEPAAGSVIKLDITEYARKQLLNENKKFSIGLTITGLEAVCDTWREYINMWSASKSGVSHNIYCSSLGTAAELSGITLSDENAVLVKKNDTTYYVGVPAESATLPEITYTTPSGVTASVKNSASAVGENTVITASSEGGLVKTDYTFIYESYTPTTGTFKTASESTGIQSTDNAIQTYDTYDRIYSYTTGKQIFSVMKFDLTDKNPSKYDKFVIGLRTQGKANKAVGGNDITADVTFEFNAVNCVDSNWTRANAVGTNFERASIVGTQIVSVNNNNMDNAYIYCDVSDYVRELLANDIKVFTISACISDVSNYCNNSSIDIRAYRADYAGNYTLDTYGPWILINKETK